MSKATSRAPRPLQVFVAVGAYWAAFCVSELAIDIAVFWLGILPGKCAKSGFIAVVAGLVFGAAAYLFSRKVAEASSAKRLIAYIAVVLLVAGVSKGVRNIYAANDAFPRVGIMKVDGTCVPF